MEIDCKTVKHVAGLSRLRLSDDEIEKFSRELSAIVTYMDKLNRADTASAAPGEHVMPVDAPARPDRPGPPAAAADILRNAPGREDGFFRVPKVIS